MADRDLDQRFHAAMLDIYRRAKVEAGYNASRFLQLVEARGGVAAARQLLTGPPSEGFAKLWEKGRLDLSVEAHILHPEFAELFTAEEQRAARERLRAFGADPDVI
jgi:hypothetical protein